ncbi:MULTISPECIES: hypothetical protein [unclassified Mesorhizobium]|uniref:hypothetical protein n=1 Tax=unclassified Mesorhizobium TaxID=325217 RepID=UPI001129158E|nr:MULTISPECIES: hypothetical protein [unclassified Mesorhizobium]TPJ40119.1 hypothetical protein FJ437_26595 [Mesorhizobium sp. B2-6-6]MBZ9702766.1 hypothetical protein [Mesorhizobium sp. CO1-1-3]MBZ9897430.1 hypothetical protein [Mesorhizobium sp. BR1-1-6]MBZ9920838.1 hypothetical protein [Mesorhizobium sp. BR1-1-7]MBZ9948515.1 hypothetical protein [Mesorhizobium sp. BR1-1-11]
MPVIDMTSKELIRAIDHYINSRRNLEWPISTAQAVSAIRYELPECTLSDKELADIVASSAIQKHRNIAFDLQS